MGRSYTYLAASLVLASALSAPGCSGEYDHGPTGTISGTLTYKGKPLREGTQVAFMQPEKGFIAFGPTDAQGNFKISSWREGNMPIGTYKVMVQPPGGVTEGAEPTAEELLAGGGKVQKAEFPAKYRQISTSDLSFDVKEGENSFQVELKD